MTTENDKPADFEVSEAGPRTPAQAMFQLAVVQTYLVEMMQVEGANGDAAAAADHVDKAIAIVSAYPTAAEH
jgi:hypothetical protein